MVSFQTQRDTSTAFTTTSTTYVDITNATVTVANQVGGKYFCRVLHHSRNAVGGGNEVGSALLDDVTIIDESLFTMHGTYHSQDTQNVGDTDGSVLKQQLKTSGSTAYWLDDTDARDSHINTIEAW